jgi:hypothetical protein
MNRSTNHNLKNENPIGLKTMPRKMKENHCTNRQVGNAAGSIMAAMLGLGLLLITGCTKYTRITTTAAGHLIHAEIAGDHAIDSHPDRGTICSPSGKITIERARAKFDDSPWTAIPEGVPVNVSISKGKLSLAAGRVTIKQTVQ